MIKRILSILLITVITIIFLCGCHSNALPTKIHFDLASEPVNLDPQTADDYSSLIIITNLFQGLYRETGEGIEADLAQSTQISEDGLTVTIKINPEARWHNKQPVTADDFVFAFQRLLMPQTNSVYAKDYYCIKNAKLVNRGELDAEKLGVKATDDHTIAFELEYPTENFLNLLAKSAAYPCNRDFFESTEGRYGLEDDDLLTNGYFYLDTWSHNEYLKLTANEAHYDYENIQITGVTAWTNDTTPLETFWNKKTYLYLMDYKSWKDGINNDFSYVDFENITNGIVFNTSNEDLRNIYIRKSIQMLFDHRKFTQSVPQDFTPSQNPIPESCVVNYQNYRNAAGNCNTVSGDVKKAKQYYNKGLSQLGKKSIQGITVIAPQNEMYDFQNAFLLATQEIQRELGLFIGVELLEEEEYQKRLESGEYTMAFVSLKAVSNNPMDILENFSYNKSSYGYYAKNNAFDNTLANMDISQNSESIESFKAAEQMLIDNALFIPLYTEGSYFVTISTLKDVEYNFSNGLIDFRNARFERKN